MAPCVCRNSRPVVSPILFENLADGLTLDEILDSYPTIPRDLALLALKGAESALERDQAREQ